MFGIGGTELVLIVLFALVIFGPDKLPGIARSVGRTLGTFKRAQEDMERMIRAEMFVTENEEKKRKAQAESDSDEGESKSAASTAAEIWNSTGVSVPADAADEGADAVAASPEKEEEGGESASPES